MRFAMMGSGAVGSYCGAKLMQAGNEVVFVARGRQLKALRENGLLLRERQQQTLLAPVTATDDVAVIGPVDVAMISVKTWQVVDIVSSLPRLQGPTTRFLTLENGVEAPHAVAEEVGIAATLGGLVRGFFELDAPGIVRHVGVTPTIIFGQIRGAHTPEAERLYRCLVDADIHTELTDHIETALWDKFMLVTSISSVGAATGLSVGQVRDDKLAHRQLAVAMAEIAAVAQAHGVDLGADPVARLLRFVATIPYEATTSMQRDIRSGLPSELDAQTGAVVRLGRQAGVPTPLHQAIYDRLIVQERQARHGNVGQTTRCG